MVLEGHAAGNVDELMRLFRSIYEFIQRRSDWKKIEKTVDKVGDSSMSRTFWPDILPGDVCSVSKGGLYCHVNIWSEIARFGASRKVFLAQPVSSVAIA